MRILLAVLGFDLRFYGGRLSTWAYGGIFFAVALLVGHIFGGAFSSADAAIGGTDGNVLQNSPYVITILLMLTNLFGLLVVAALAGNAGYRDFGAGIHPLFFTTPVSKWPWLTGRYIASVLLGTLVIGCAAVALAVTPLGPWIEADRFGPFRAATYLVPVLVLVLPNVALTAALFLPIAALSRSRLPHYVGGMFLLVAYLVGGQLMGELGSEQVAALVDPFGSNAITYSTRYWTTFERNTLDPCLEPWVLANRALWLTVAAALFAAATTRFRFTHLGPRFGWGRVVPVEPESSREALVPRAIALPPATQHFDARARWTQLRSVFRRTFRDMLGNAAFGAIIAAGVLFLGFVATQIGDIYGTTTWPVTYMVLESLGGTFGLFLVITLTFYAGELVWHERDLGVHLVLDAMPVPSWVPWLAKITALFAMLAALMLVVGVVGVTTQLAHGYTHLELGLYLRHLYTIQLPDYLLLCILAVAVQAVVNHKYLGHLLVIGWYGLSGFMVQFGLEHPLWRYGSDLGSRYSDMNDFGPYLWPFLVFKLTWGGVAVLLAALSQLFWVRGRETGWRWRLVTGRARLSAPVLAVGGTALATTVGLAAYILVNTHVWNEHRTSWERQIERLDWETKYKRYEDLPQPRITDVKVEVDLYPQTGDLGIEGSYRLRNKTDQPVSQVHVRVPTTAEIRALAFDRAAEVTEVDDRLGYQIHTLAAPLQPGETLGLSWSFWFPDDGFPSRGQNTTVVDNGTFVHSTSIVPGIGYHPGGELSTDRIRKKHGLEPKERMADLDDTAAHGRTYISRDADWVTFEATVSTDPDQIALAPGYLQREWTEGGRRHFHYAMDAPILNFYAFQSARYVVAKDRWRDVSIEVYHHPGHTWNVQRMIDAVKASLEVYSEAFSPYQHRQMRIVEFPRYATFAQSFPNTVPYSEGIGFIANVQEGDIDYPFYVTAHEVAHQWWAHQVIGADVQGSTVMSETLSQYSALLVMERELGSDTIKDFLEYELNSYLRGRGGERKKELPLMRVENQQYIHYNKGALAMWLLKDHIGAEAVNRGLAAYIDEVAFQEPPYTTSRDLLRHLRAVTPPDRQYLLDDLFEHITLFDNRALEATAKAVGPYWEVTLTYQAGKLRADDAGREEEVPMRDFVDIGIFDADGEPLYLEKHPIEAGEHTIRLMVEGEPAEMGIDPWHRLVDRHPDDNLVDVDIASP